MQRSVPSWLLYFIVILAAFIFQTGRVNLKAQGSGARRLRRGQVVRKACDLGSEAPSNEALELVALGSPAPASDHAPYASHTHRLSGAKGSSVRSVVR